MKYSQAENLIKQLLPITQKFRSNARESINQATGKRGNKFPERINEMVLLDMFPWIFDDTRLMRVLTLLNERIDNGGKIQGIEFYNIMTIFDRFEPEAKLAIELAFSIKIPAPDPRVVVGWDEE